MKKILLAFLLTFMFIGCSNITPNKQERLLGKEYILITSTDETKISINFAEDNFFGFSGVNTYFGKLKMEKNNLNLSRMGVTMVAGPKEDMDREQAYLAKLRKVKTYQLKNERLILNTSNGEQLIFRRKM